MTTDGGGWTRLFVTETTNNAFDVAPETSTFPGLDYTIDNQTLRDDAVTALVTYVDSSDDIVGSYATFDFPTNWKSQSPLMYSNESESVDVSVNGIYIGSEILVYGKDNWTTYTCDDEWGNSFTSGQFCITNTTAPYYTRWASEIVDRCTDSNSNEQPGLGGAECTTDTRFSILVRRSTEEPALSCLDILESGDSTGDGTYWIDPDGTGAFEAYCDMMTDGGGWLLLYSYSHEGGTNPTLNEAELPLTLNASLSHTSTSAIGYSDISEARFYCDTSEHERIIHFTTSNEDIMAMAMDLSAPMAWDHSDWSSGFTEMSGHTGYLPALTSHHLESESLTEFPFYVSGLYHWGMRAHDTRWECDGNALGGPDIDDETGYDYTTTHHIWVR
jgi:hypothetical protein